MKKIFAIALALVMVLSMASAFALNNCSGNFDWTCPASVNKCGKGSVEVIPYVKVNNSCGGIDWQVSTCASAVNTEDVFYAVKLTVEANADAKWWAKAKVTLSYKGMDAAAFTPSSVADMAQWMKDNDVADKENTLYLNFVTGGWELVTDSFEFGGDYIKCVPVKKASEAKICAKLTSDHDGFDTWTYGDYTVKVETGKITFTNKAGKVLTLTYDDEKVTKVEDNDKIYADVFATFNLNCGIGTCIDKDIIKRNFGWDDKVESCFSWSDKAPSIVDADCVVAIPKTGDVSVVAYAVMAVVAAAGTMLKK